MSDAVSISIMVENITICDLWGVQKMQCAKFAHTTKCGAR